MNIKNVLSIIDTLREGWYNPPVTYDQKKVEFLYQSYRHSAIKEIKIYLMEHKNENPISAVEEFRYQMDSYACCSKNGDTNFMFSVYYDVATDVLDALIGMGVNRKGEN